MRPRLLDVDESERASVVDAWRTIVRKRKVVVKNSASPRVYNLPSLDAPICRSLTKGEHVDVIGPEVTYITSAKKVYTFAETIEGGWIVVKIDGKSVVKKSGGQKSSKELDKPLVRQVHYVSGLEGSGFSASELVEVFIGILDCAVVTLRRSAAIDFNGALRSITRRSAVLFMALDYRMKVELDAIARSGLIADLKTLSICHLVGNGEKSASSSPSRLTESESPSAIAVNLAHAALKSVEVCQAALNVCGNQVNVALELLKSKSDADLQALARSQTSTSSHAFDTVVVLKPTDAKAPPRSLHEQPSDSKLIKGRSISGSIDIHAKHISGEWAQLSSRHNDKDLWVRTRIGPVVLLEFETSPKTTQWTVRIVQPDALPDKIFRNVALPYLKVFTAPFA